MWLQRIVFWVWGYVFGIATFLILVWALSEQQAVAVPEPVAASSQAAPAVAQVSPTPAPASLTYATVCDADTNNMTDPQIAAYAQQFVGQRISNWRGWVYDVVSRSDGSYNLEIAMEERGFLWTRDVVVENIASDLAVRLNVEQPVTLSGRIARVETMFEVMCNPLYVDSMSLVEHH